MPKKMMDINEFREEGFLQEANRQFFHPLGLALEVIMSETGAAIGGIWDYRSDPKGIVYADLDKQTVLRKVHAFRIMQQDKHDKRMSLLGFNVQPVDTLYLRYEEISNGQA